MKKLVTTVRASATFNCPHCNHEIREQINIPVSIDDTKPSKKPMGFK